MLQCPHMEKRNKETKRPVRTSYTYRFKVNRSDALLDYLLGRLNLSRNSVKGLLHDRKVLVNGTVETRFDYPLAKDDEVRIAKEPVRAANAQQSLKGKGKKKNPIKHCIIYEDDDFLVINKPAGLLSVESDTEKECAYAYAADYLKSRDPKARPYVLHRIDKETSGVLVFAKNIKLHSMLKGHWNEDVALREYYALVEGLPKEEKGTCTVYLAENTNHIVYVSRSRSAKKAVTHYETVRKNGVYALLRVRIDTGRKNQIRVTFADKGFPVVGDDKYGHPESPIGRLGLHAFALEFIHPVTKQTMHFEAKLPAEFNRVFAAKKPES